RLLDLLRQGAQLVDDAGQRELVFIQLPRRELPLDGGAEEVGFLQTVDGQELLELRELQGTDALPCLERADRLLANARKAGNIFLAQAANAADFSKFENDIHDDFLTFH